MELALEKLSGTSRKLTISLSAEEVNAALNKTLAAYSKDLSLPGFRRGKVPAKVVQQRLGQTLFEEATRDALGSRVNAWFVENEIQPCSPVRDADEEDAFFAWDAAFSRSLLFEVLPDIDFPPYVGLKAEQVRSEVSDEEVEAQVEEMRNRLARLAPMPEARVPQEGDVVEVDFSGFDPENLDEPLKDINNQRMRFVIGRKEVLPEFEELVKSLHAGMEGSTEAVFPEDYHHAGLAGKPVHFQVTLKKVFTRQLPSDEEMARDLGQEDMEKAREAFRSSIKGMMEQQHASIAMKKLLDGLMEQVGEIEVPDSLLEERIARVLHDRDLRLRQLGKSLEDTGKSQDELREEARAEALEALRPQVFLMALARKEKLSVSEREVESTIYSIAVRAGQDYRQVSEAYHRSGLIKELVDRILADKGMDFIYSKADITYVDAPAPSEEADGEAKAGSEEKADDEAKN